MKILKTLKFELQATVSSFLYSIVAEHKLQQESSSLLDPRLRGDDASGVLE
jgi:hypothetical protein